MFPLGGGDLLLEQSASDPRIVDIPRAERHPGTAAQHDRAIPGSTVRCRGRSGHERAEKSQLQGIVEQTPIDW